MQMRCLLTLVFVTSSVCAQSLTETQTLRSLARIWGFLKYNHPAVATGRYNWDNQLIQLIPAVRHAQNRDQLSAIYLGVLDTLGPIKRCKSCILMGNIPAANRRNLDLSVLDDSTLLSPELRKKLIYINDNRNQQANFYVQRIKNVIQYFFPYKYALDGDWNDVLMDLIPVFRQATTELAYQQAIYQLTARIQDSHGFLMTVDQSRCMRCELGRFWLPFAVKLINNKALNLQFPGVSHPVGSARLPAVAGKRLYRGKVIVLINEDSQSHAEFTAMAFRLVPGVTFVGSPTAGADGNISWVPLPGGYRTAFSGLGVYYPDGRETQRVGIKPDIEIKPTIVGLSEGCDEVLIKALELSLQPH